MNAIEKALHHPILRVETKDFDEMEKVSVQLAATKSEHKLTMELRHYKKP